MRKVGAWIGDFNPFIMDSNAVADCVARIVAFTNKHPAGVITVKDPDHSVPMDAVTGVWMSFLKN
jgi:hypothetical protein